MAVASGRLTSLQFEVRDDVTALLARSRLASDLAWQSVRLLEYLPGSASGRVHIVSGSEMPGEFNISAPAGDERPPFVLSWDGARFVAWLPRDAGSARHVAANIECVLGRMRSLETFCRVESN